MAFIVETGSGTPGANSYVSTAFALSYLTDRGREGENDWDSFTTPEQEEFIVSATDYIETRFGGRFMGTKLQSVLVGREAFSSLTLTGLPTDTETFTLGQKTYRMVNALAAENDVLIGADITATIANMVAAINTGGGDAGTEDTTIINYEAGATDSDPILSVAARVKGENGNLIAWSTTIVNSTILGSGFLANGLDEAEQPLSFPRNGLVTRDGTTVIGVPLNLKQATVEYASRAAASVLAPDPTFDPALVNVVGSRSKVGPIEEEVRYAEGGVANLTVPYPAADRLLEEYLLPSGGTFRG